MKKVAGYIKRKSMLYKTGVEYGDYSMNHIMGCSHGCKYPCYAFLMAKRFGKVTSYEEWIKPYLVCNTLEILDNEISRLKSKISSVQLCFSTDPFMYEYDEVKKMSLAAVKKLNDAGIKCIILTKGLLPTELAAYSKDNVYGITLISLNEKYREQIEPGATSFRDRIEALKYLHEQGCRTWVSIEPYPTPNLIEQNLISILENVAFTNKIIFGRTNYSKEISSFQAHKIFFHQQAKKVMEFCEKRKIQYHIKNGTMVDECKFVMDQAI